jgi:hypothetical protein
MPIEAWKRSASFGNPSSFRSSGGILNAFNRAGFFGFSSKQKIRRFEGLTQKVADDILLGEEYENMTTADAKVRALPGSAVTVEIVQAPSKDVLAKLEQHTRYGCTAWIPFYALRRA